MELLESLNHYKYKDDREFLELPITPRSCRCDSKASVNIPTRTLETRGLPTGLVPCFEGSILRNGVPPTGTGTML
jgi:hypothetical protein